MNGITLQWLQSEPICEVMKYDGKPEEIKHMLPEAAVEWQMLLAAAILTLCLLLLLVWVAGVWRKRRGALRMPPTEADDFITQELPVAAVQASLQALRTLEEIVYCESEEIIS